MISQTSQLSTHAIYALEGESIPTRTARCAPLTVLIVSRAVNSSVENSRRKRSLPDIAHDHTPERDSKEHGSVVASTSALVSVPGTKRGPPCLSLVFCSASHTASYVSNLAKRAETRKCPVCGEHIPLRLLGQHYTLESSRVQTILDHVGDLECFSDPHALAHAQYVCHPCTHSRWIDTVVLEYIFTQSLHRSSARRRATLQHREGSTAFAARLEKTLSSIKRRRKARNMALRVVTRDEDDVPVARKGKGRARATTEQCPICLQDVEGDLDVIEAHVDACLAHTELHRPGGGMDTEDDGNAPRNVEDNGGDDVWEESETPDGVRRLRLRQGARADAAALGFVVGDRTVDDVDDEIDVEGDDLSAFGAVQFTEADVLTDGGDSERSRHDSAWRVAETDVDVAIERARHAKDPETQITAFESKVRLLMVSQSSFLHVDMGLIIEISQGAPADGTAFGCRICLELYSEPTVSVGCWHVCCSACWLRCLDASGVCPICKRITTRSDLRRIYL